MVRRVSFPLAACRGAVSGVTWRFCRVTTGRAGSAVPARIACREEGLTSMTTAAAAVTGARPRSGSNTVRVLAVHAAPLVRLGLRTRLQTAPRWQWLGSTGDARVLLPAMGRLNPHLLLLDSALDPSGTLTEAIVHRHSYSSVVLLVRAEHRSPSFVGRARQAGAAGVVPDDASPATLPTFLRRAIQGDVFAHPMLTGGAAPRPQQRLGGTTGSSATDGAPVLSARETQVLQLIADGLNTDGISIRLTISRETVRTHVKRILHKLDAASRAQAIARAYLYGLLADPACGDQQAP